MLKIIALSGIMFSGFKYGFAQVDSTVPKYAIKANGYIDAYYRNSFSTPKGVTNNFTSFTNSNNKIALGMASLKVDQVLGKLSASIDLGVGKRAEEFSYNDKGFMANLKQAYLTYNWNDKLKISAGKWATHVGYELVDAHSNRLYSMSYGFSYGPFFHTGVKAEYALSNKSSFMISLANPSDYVSTKSTSKVLLLQFMTKLLDNKTTLYANYQGGNTGGQTNYNQLDLVVLNTLSSKWALNYDGTIFIAKNGTGKQWTSNALYLNYDPTTNLGFSFRSELFNDANAITSGAFGTSIFSNTLSLQYKIKKMTFIPELRLDHAKNNIYLNGGQKECPQNASFIIAAIYQF